MKLMKNNFFVINSRSEESVKKSKAWKVSATLSSQPQTEETRKKLNNEASLELRRSGRQSLLSF